MGTHHQSCHKIQIHYLPQEEVRPTRICEGYHQDMTVNYIRCNNSGENLNIGSHLIINHINNVTIKRTDPYTPKKNAKVEREFVILYDCV